MIDKGLSAIETCNFEITEKRNSWNHNYLLDECFISSDVFVTKNRIFFSRMKSAITTCPSQCIRSRCTLLQLRENFVDIQTIISFPIWEESENIFDHFL